MKRLSLFFVCLVLSAMFLPASALAVAVDDWFPGTTIPGTPFTGTLNGGSDVIDIYKVVIPAGQQIAFRIEGDKPGAWLWLFKPGSKDIIPANEVGMSDTPESGYYPQLLRQRDLLGGGTYYLAVTWDFGIQPTTVKYKVSYTRPPVTTRSDLPGEALTQGVPARGNLDEMNNWVEAYNLPAVPKGWGIHMRVIDQPEVSYDWGVLSGGSSVYSPKLPYLPLLNYRSEVAATEASTVASFEAPQDGTYYAFLSLLRATNAYSIEMTTTPPTTLEVTPTATTIEYGAPVRFNSLLADADGPIDAGDVRLERLTSGDGSSLRNWSAVQSALTTPTGTSALQGSLTATSYLRIRYPGELWETSPAVRKFKISVRPSLSVPKQTSKPRANSTFSVVGSLKPQHKAGKAAVTVKAYKKVGSRWVLSKTFTGLGASSYRYTSKVKLGKGSWKLVAYHKPDSTNAEKLSSPRYFTIR